MAQEQQSDSTTPAGGQSRGSEQAPSGRSRLTGQPDSESFDFDAFAEESTAGSRYEAEADKFKQERIVEEAANRGITPEQLMGQPEQEATQEEPEPGQGDSERTPRPSDRFKGEDDARSGYDNLMTLQARQAEELGNLRGVAARYQAEKAVRAEMGQQPTQQPGQPARPQNDPRHMAYLRAVQFQKERYGLDDQEAQLAAQEMIGLVDYLAGQKVEQAAVRIRPLVDRYEGEKALQERVNRVALEQTGNGQYARPDWQEVTTSEEFAQVVKAEPDLIQSDLGLRHAYQTAKYMQTASPKAMAQEAGRLKAEAQQVVRQEKARATSASPNLSSPDKRGVVDEDQAAFDGMFEVGKDRHMLSGGPRRR